MTWVVSSMSFSPATLPATAAKAPDTPASVHRTRPMMVPATSITARLSVSNWGLQAAGNTGSNVSEPPTHNCTPSAGGPHSDTLMTGHRVRHVICAGSLRGWGTAAAVVSHHVEMQHPAGHPPCV